jgi:ribulose-phosphate 3-epimerase
VRSIEIYPSLLAADFSRLGEEICTVEMAGADGIHFDVMDGHFVPNISFGAVVLESIRNLTDLPFWVHLMITDPAKYAADFIQAGANGLFIHPEIGAGICDLAEEISRQGVLPGLAINPDTGFDRIKSLIPYFEDFLIMTVHPGFGGQSLIESPLKKIPRIKTMAKRSGSKCRVHVDGGVNMETVEQVVAAGTDVLVAGSSIFGMKDQAGALKTMRKLAEESVITNVKQN